MIEGDISIPGLHYFALASDVIWNQTLMIICILFGFQLCVYMYFTL